MKKLLFSVLFASMGFGANTAMADGWPLSVLGSWSVLANQSAGTLSITSQGSIQWPHPLPAQFWRNYNPGLHRKCIAGGIGTSHGRDIRI